MLACGLGADGFEIQVTFGRIGVVAVETMLGDGLDGYIFDDDLIVLVPLPAAVWATTWMSRKPNCAKKWKVLASL